MATVELAFVVSCADNNDNQPPLSKPNNNLEIHEAAQVLGIAANAPSEARQQAFKTQSRKLQLKLQQAPTDALKVKYGQALKRLEEAYETLELLNEESDLPALRADLRSEAAQMAAQSQVDLNERSQLGSTGPMNPDGNKVKWLVLPGLILALALTWYWVAKKLGEGAKINGSAQQQGAVKQTFNESAGLAHKADLESAQFPQIASRSSAQVPHTSRATADNWFNSAEIKRNKHDWKGAIADYTVAISHDPQFVDAYLRRGMLKDFQSDDPKGAMDDFNQAIWLNPKSNLAFFFRAIAKQRKNDYDGAIADYSVAISIKETADAYLRRGEAMQQKSYGADHDPEKIISDFTRAIALNPSLIAVYYHRGDEKVYKHDWQGAINDYTTGLGLDPGSAMFYGQRSYANRQKGDLEGAKADNDKFNALGGTQAALNETIKWEPF